MLELRSGSRKFITLLPTYCIVIIMWERHWKEWSWYFVYCHTPTQTNTQHSKHIKRLIYQSWLYFIVTEYNATVPNKEPIQRPTSQSTTISTESNHNQQRLVCSNTAKVQLLLLIQCNEWINNNAEWGPQTLRQACSRENPRAQCAFKILMIHEVLQFALRIAFRCVLHRCGNLDIHRWKLFW